MVVIRNRRGQQFAEYALVLGLVVLAVSAMTIYFARSMKGKIKSAADHMGDGLTLNAGYTDVPVQYNEYYNENELTTKTDMNVNEAYQTGGAVARTSQSEKAQRTGTARTGTGFSQDDFWNNSN